VIEDIRWGWSGGERHSRSPRGGGQHRGPGHPRLTRRAIHEIAAAIAKLLDENKSGDTEDGEPPRSWAAIAEQLLSTYEAAAADNPRNKRNDHERGEVMVVGPGRGSCRGSATTASPSPRP